MPQLVAHGPDDVAHLWMTVEDYLSEQLDEVSRPSGDVVPVLTASERAQLVARLRAQPPAVCQSLYDAQRRFWEGVTEHTERQESLGIPAPSLRQQLVDAGFRLEDVP